MHTGECFANHHFLLVRTLAEKEVPIFSVAMDTACRFQPWIQRLNADSAMHSTHRDLLMPSAEHFTVNALHSQGHDSVCQARPTISPRRCVLMGVVVLVRILTPRPTHTSYV